MNRSIDRLINIHDQRHVWSRETAQSDHPLPSNNRRHAGTEWEKEEEAQGSHCLSPQVYIFLHWQPFLSLSRLTGVCSTNCWKETGRLVFPVSCNILYVCRSHDLLLTEGVQKKHKAAIVSLLRFYPSPLITLPPSPSLPPSLSLSVGYW